MIRVGGFALFGKETIGLRKVSVNWFCEPVPDHIPECRVPSNKAAIKSVNDARHQRAIKRIGVPPSMSWQFDSQPVRLEKPVSSDVTKSSQLEIG